MTTLSSLKSVHLEQRQKEYDPSFTHLMQLTLGEGFLSFGGTSLIDKIFSGVGLEGKKILDVGCGLGGPLRYLAEKHRVDIIGVDIEPDVIFEAQQIHFEKPLKGTLSFQVIENGNYPFANEFFDIIFGKESWLHIENKPIFFKTLYPLLKPGGRLMCTDWMHADPIYSEDMKRFLIIDGLTFHLTTTEEYKDALASAGFKHITFEDISTDMIKEFKEVYLRHFDELGEQIKERYGWETYYMILHSWLLQRVVFEKGEILVNIFHALK